MKRHLYVIEEWTGRRWAIAETISLALAVYATRADARRDLHNGEVGYRLRSDVRIVKYVPAGGVR